MNELSGLILETYEIRGILGRGGMGVVYHAFDRTLGREVAIKCPTDELLRDPAALEQFRREAIAAGRINSPYVATIFRVADYDERPLIVMEVVRGTSLRRVLQDSGPLPAADVMDIGVQVAEALVAAHAEGIVHSDIKPANIFLGEGGQVKVMDFGIARLTEPGARSSAPAAAEGTAAYMAPEQASGTRDARSDLYALGVVLYELSSGCLPFEAETNDALLVRKLSEIPLPPSRWGANLPPSFERLVLQLIERDVENRPSDARRVVQMLRELRAHAHTPRRTGTRRPASDVVPLIGRADDLARLREMAERAALGNGGVVLITGASGSGKTRLADDLAKYASEHGLTVVRARCTSDDPAMNGLPLRRALGDTLPASAEAIEGAAIARAGDGPLLLLVDDAHWMDPLSAATLHLIAGAASAHALLLCVCVGTDDGSRLPAHVRSAVRALRRIGRVSEHALGRLSDDDTRELVATLLGGRVAADDVHARLVTLSGGWPGMAIAAVRALQEDALLRIDGDRWVLAPSNDADPLPSVVASALDRRLATLSADERALLNCAAVAGETFAPVVVAAALHRDRLQVLQSLHVIETDVALVHSGEDATTFDAPVLARRLREALSAPLRRELHGRIARALEECAPESAERTAALAQHDYAAGDYLRALPALRASGAHFAETFAYEDALRSFTGALDCLERAADDSLASDVIDVRGELGRLCIALGRLDDAAIHLDTARGLGLAYGRTDAVARFDKQLGDVEFSRKNWDSALECYERAERAFTESCDVHGLCDVYRSMGNIHFQKGEFDAVVADYDKALAIAENIGDDQQIARACNNLGAVSNVLGERQKALAHYHRSVEHYKRADDRVGQTQTTLNIGLTYAALRNWPEAANYYRRSASMAEDMQDSELIAISRLALAEAEVHLKMLDDAEADCDRALATFLSRHDRLGAADSYRVRGIVMSRAGRAAEAEQAFNECLTISEAVGGRLQTAEGQRDYAEHLISTGEYDEAEVLLEAARAAFEELSAREHVAEVDRVCATLNERREEAA